MGKTPPKVPILTINGEVIYALQPRQFEAWSYTPLARGPDEEYPRHIGYGGAAGGGKSFLARAVGVTACLTWAGCTGIIFRRTKDEVRKNHVRAFLEEVPKKVKGHELYSWNGSDLTATFYNHSELHFGFLRYAEDVLKHQGNQYDFMIFEEATHYKWADVRWLTGNRLRATRPYCRPFVLYPSNPGNIGHAWYKRIFIKKRYDERLNEREDQYAFIQAKVQDNFELMARDPEYVLELMTLPEPHRSWLMNGDWEAGLGLALPMMDPVVHFVEPFRPPRHWPMFASFDWGYNHPWCFGVYTADEDGRAYKIDGIKGRNDLPHMIADKIIGHLSKLDLSLDQINAIHAGKDTFDEHKARNENTASIWEQLCDVDPRFGRMVRANVARIHGLNNLRRFLAWENVLLGENGYENDRPYLLFMDTEANRECYEQLESLPTDPDNVEDALKIDADDFGNGGDDWYDETRYAMSSRYPPARSEYPDPHMSAWHPEMLLHEATEGRRAWSKVTEPVTADSFGV